MARPKKTEAPAEEIDPVKRVSFQFPAPFLDEVEAFCNEYGLRMNFLFQKAVEMRMDLFRLVESEMNKRLADSVRGHPSLLPTSAIPKMPPKS